jgi:hypothetical protein
MLGRVDKKTGQWQIPRRRGQKEMLCHARNPGKMAMAFFTLLQSKFLIPSLGAVAPKYRVF